MKTAEATTTENSPNVAEYAAAAGEQSALFAPEKAPPKKTACPMHGKIRPFVRWGYSGLC